MGRPPFAFQREKQGKLRQEIVSGGIPADIEPAAIALPLPEVASRRHVSDRQEVECVRFQKNAGAEIHLVVAGSGILGIDGAAGSRGNFEKRRRNRKPDIAGL